MTYLNKEWFKLLGIWFYGWLIFGLVETVFRFIKYAAFPWYKGPVVMPMYLLLILVYGIAGILAGLSVIIVLQILSKWSFSIRVETKCLCMSLCQALIMLLYCAYYLYEEHLHHNLLYMVGCLAFCILIFLMLYIFLKKKLSAGHIFSAFIASSLILDILLAGSVNIKHRLNESELEDFFSFSLPLNVCALITACFLVYLSFKLMPPVYRRLIKMSAVFQGRKAFLFLSITAGLLILFFFFRYPDIKSTKHSAEINSKPNIIVVTMDTTRRDHLSCYGYKKSTTPNLDSFAKTNVLFNNAYSSSSWTLPAHASIFTGLYPSRHGAHVREGLWGHKILGDSNITLAEILSQHGYKTAGIIGGYFCSSYFGFSQGFDYYNDNLIDLLTDFNNFFLLKIIRRLFPVSDFIEKHGFAGKKIASQINHSAFKWLENNHKKPFFLFLNYFDPHAPYLPIESPQTRVSDSFYLQDSSYTKWEKILFKRILTEGHILKKNEKEYIIDRYDSDIKQMDMGIGELFKFLKKLKVYDKSLIIITSDHGESFGEHGLLSHTPVVYEELVKVPLIVKYPDDNYKTDSISTPVSVIDIMPEVLSVAKIPIPKDIQGVPFSQRHDNIIVERYNDKHWKGKGASNFLGERSLLAIYEGDYKFIWASNDKHELYNLTNDPQELNNLYGQAAEIEAILKKKLGQFELPSDNDHSSDSPNKFNREMNDALKALGYIQ